MTWEELSAKMQQHFRIPEILLMKLFEIGLYDIKQVIGIEDGLIKKTFGKDISILDFYNEQEEENSYQINYHGIDNVYTCDLKILNVPEYQILFNIYNTSLKQILKPPFYVFNNGKMEFDSLKKVYEYVEVEGKTGMEIQRYKGLGEMNPEQLWETTMDPQKRVLIKVAMQDGVAADAAFTILMGAEVEPRRKFLEDNALRVKNLDV